MYAWVLDFAKKCPVNTGKVIEVGSLNVNGSVRKAFKHANYIGVDMRPGPDVDEVYDAVDLTKHHEPGSADIVVSVEALEHCEHWKLVVQAMWTVLKDGGWLVLTACKPGKAYHDYPHDYWRFTCDDFKRIFVKHRILLTETGHVSSGIIVQKIPDQPINLGFDVMSITK